MYICLSMSKSISMVYMKTCVNSIIKNMCKHTSSLCIASSIVSWQTIRVTLIISSETSRCIPIGPPVKKAYWNIPIIQNWLVVSTHLKNISQIGNLPQIGAKIKIFETTTQKTYARQTFLSFGSNAGFDPPWFLIGQDSSQKMRVSTFKIDHMLKEIWHMNVTYIRFMYIYNSLIW